jgi:hypothetical protein
MDAENEDIELKMEGVDMFVLVNGVKVARRGHKGTPQAKTWISLEPGWRVERGTASRGVGGSVKFFGGGGKVAPAKPTTPRTLPQRDNRLLPYQGPGCRSS